MTRAKDAARGVGRTKLLSIRQQHAAAALKEHEVLHGSDRRAEAGNLRGRGLGLGGRIGRGRRVRVRVFSLGVATLFVGLLKGVALLRHHISGDTKADHINWLEVANGGRRKQTTCVPDKTSSANRP